RVPRAGDKVEAAGGAGLPRDEGDHRPGDGIRAAQVVEQPAVDALLREGLLDGGEVHYRPPTLSFIDAPSYPPPRGGEGPRLHVWLRTSCYFRFWSLARRRRISR